MSNVDTLRALEHRARGQPKTGGRKAGTPTKSTVEIRALSQSYTREYLRRAVAAAAARELLDRGYGRPTEIVSGDRKDRSQEIVGAIQAVAVTSPPPQEEVV